MWSQLYCNVAWVPVLTNRMFLIFSDIENVKKEHSKNNISCIVVPATFIAKKAFVKK